MAESLHALFPDLKTLYMSGYTVNVIAHRGILEDGVNFIQKPFSRQDLAAKIRAVYWTYNTARNQDETAHELL